MKRWERRLVRPLSPVLVVGLVLMGFVAPYLLIDRVGGTLAVVAGVSLYVAYLAAMAVGTYVRLKALVNGRLQGMSWDEIDEMFSRPKKRPAGEKP